MNEQKQVGQLCAVVIQNLPKMTAEQRQVCIKNPLAVQKVLLGLVKLLKAVFRLKPAIERDMTGWECNEPVTAEGEFEFSTAEFLCEGEFYVNGEEMVKRAKTQGVATGLRHLEAMLREQDEIPEELRKFVLVFSEVWLDLNGSRSVFYLYWENGRCCLGYSRLKSGFDSRFRLVVSRKYQK